MGEGEVQRVAGECVTVLFESEGYKTLSVEAVEAGELVEPPEDEGEAALRRR